MPHRGRRGNQENANPQDSLECRARGIAKTALPGVEPFGQGLVEHQDDHRDSGCPAEPQDHLVGGMPGSAAKHS